MYGQPNHQEASEAKIDLCACCQEPIGSDRNSFPALFLGRICSGCENNTKRNPQKPYPIDPSVRKYELAIAKGTVKTPFTSLVIRLVDGTELCSPVKLTPTGKASKGLIDCALN